MGELVKEQRVLGAHRLALAAVGDDDRVTARGLDGAHLDGGWEACAAAAAKPRALGDLEDARAVELGERTVALEVAVQLCQPAEGDAAQQAWQCGSRDLGLVHRTGVNSSVPLTDPELI